MATERVHIGVDVSKNTLDVFIPNGKTLRVRNAPAAVRRMVLGISAREPSAVFCCESTGGYEKTLLDVCREEGRSVCLMNAQQVRCYAGHLGTLEKTDRIDARMISMAADDKKPAPLVHPTGRQRKLKELWTLRTALVKERDRVRNQLEHLGEKETVAAVRKVVAAIGRQLSSLEKRCRGLVKEDKDSAAFLGRVQLVKGVGPVTALALAALLPELPVLDGKRLAKLAGLAPIAEQNGTMDGPRHIQKGRGLVRRALYFAAVMHKLLCLLRRIAQNPDFVPAST
jgi:transposase